MDLKLVGKRALVTGSSAGLGEAIVKMLAAEGAAVVVHGRNESRANAVAEAIREKGGKADVVLGDLSTDAGADTVVKAALAGGNIDILVNNAGDYDKKELTAWFAASPTMWAEIYNQNVISAIRMIQRLVPAMRERRWGRVIQIGGGLASQPMSVQPHYNASLAARHNLAVSLSRELKDSGVTSNIVSPGAMLTNAVQELVIAIAPAHGWSGTWEQIEHGAAAEWIPNDIGRFGRADEIAAAVAYFASDYAEYVSGATIRVDGGLIKSVF